MLKDQTGIHVKPPGTRFRDTLWSCRRYFASAAAFSLAINLLYLAGPLYMLQVYDRVISSGSEITLVMLTIALLMAFAALAALDAVRARILTRLTVRLDRSTASRIMMGIIERSPDIGGAPSQLLRDFDLFRQAVTGPAMHCIFDLPWTPIYLLVILMLHPLLGAFALACSMLLVTMAVVNELVVKFPLAEAGEAAARNYRFTEMGLRNVEVVRAMGMTEGLLGRWGLERGHMLHQQVIASCRAASVASLMRFLRLSMQSLILGLGAYLVIERAATVGMMFAASILLGRALQPVEQLVGSWRSLVAARAAFRRIGTLLSSFQPRTCGLQLPRPTGLLCIEDVFYAPPNSSRPILRGVTVRVEAGEVLGVIGPSGAGKSTLARLILGVLSPSAGVVRLDGAVVCQWPRDLLGRYLGYLPQDIELFSDSVALNISRFHAGEGEAVVDAARMAGVHEMILRLPRGYDTQVGEGGANLSGGYRQRIGLARAVYGKPSLVVLDEPSSNLDAEGDGALAACVVRLKERGVTVVIISHRPSTVNIVDKLLVIRDGVVELLGPRVEVMARLTRPVPVHAVAAVV